MKLKRLWQTFRLYTIRGGSARVEYIRRQHVYGAIGEHCMIQKRKVPLYANLIRLGNNVHIASNVSFVTHDVTHSMLNRVPSVRERGGVQEKVGCIEIGDNVFVGAGTRILYDTRIGSNVIIGTGSVVTRDIPDNSVAAGVPARVIGSFDAFVDKALQRGKYPEGLKPHKQVVPDRLAELLWDEFDRRHTADGPEESAGKE